MSASRTDQVNPPDVFEAARAAVYGYIYPHKPRLQGVPAVASKMGIPVGTLYNKLNLHDHHKLTVQDLLQIITITGDFAPLIALCHTFALVCFAAPDLSRVSDGALLEIINKIGVEGGQFHAAVGKALADGKISAADYRTVSAEALDYMAAIAEAASRFKGMVDE